MSGLAVASPCSALKSTSIFMEWAERKSKVSLFAFGGCSRFSQSANSAALGNAQTCLALLSLARVFHETLT